MERDAGGDFYSLYKTFAIGAIPKLAKISGLAEWYRLQVTTAFEAVPFENSTHMLISDHPEEFAREVVKVLEEE